MKSTLDPFLQEKPEDVDRLMVLQKDIYKTFTDMVLERRKGKLKAEESELFTGAFWTGRRALKLGLIDGLGELSEVMRDRYGDNVKFCPIEQRQSWFKQKLGIGASLKILKKPQSIIPALVEEGFIAVEERSLWNKFGL
jgi:ClpP class serine protease